MLILLPPSEGKASPRRGKPLDLDALSIPGLTPARARVLDVLVEHCAADPAAAAATLGLGPTQADKVAANSALLEAPTARADQVYTGVLYEALDLGSLDAGARRRASSRVAIVSALFGLVRPADRIPAYRLSGQVSLPGLGPVARHWSDSLGPVMTESAGTGVVLDLRSSVYAAFWRPEGDLAGRTATVRVLHEHNGMRKVVSHFNKATKGRLVRALLEDGGAPRTVSGLVSQMRDLGWTVEHTEPAGGPARSRPHQVDVVVSEV